MIASYNISCCRLNRARIITKLQHWYMIADNVKKKERKRKNSCFKWQVTCGSFINVFFPYEYVIKIEILVDLYSSTFQTLVYIKAHNLSLFSCMNKKVNTQLLVPVWMKKQIDHKNLSNLPPPPPGYFKITIHCVYLNLGFFLYIRKYLSLDPLLKKMVRCPSRGRCTLF